MRRSEIFRRGERESVPGRDARERGERQDAGMVCGRGAGGTDCHDQPAGWSHNDGANLPSPGNLRLPSFVNPRGSQGGRSRVLIRRNTAQLPLVAA